MTNWIHVNSATKIPFMRDNRTSAVESFPTGTDPNDSAAFGPDQPSMFLLIVDAYQPEPSYNSVQEKLVPITTVGSDGLTYEGHFVNPDWKQEFQVVPRSLEESKQEKAAALEDDYQAFLDAGYADGQNIFRFDEEEFQSMSARYQAQQLIGGGLKIGLNTQADPPVLVEWTANAFQTFFTNYADAFLSAESEYNRASRQIREGNSLGQVDAITWAF